MLMLCCLTLAFSGILADSMPEDPTDQFPRANLLIEPADLAKDPARFVILDLRPEAEYQRGHVPGAIPVDARNWKASFDARQDAAAWQKIIGDLGIDGTKPVVVYEGGAGAEAGRVWWILSFWSVPDVRLLHGFWNGWLAAELPVEMKGNRPTAATFTARARSEILATKDQIAKSLKEGSPALQIVDARSFGEYCGTVPFGNPRTGHIPTARHLDWSELFQPGKLRRFKSPTELRRLFADRGIDLNKPTAAHCQGGGRSAIMVFSMQLLGADKAANYHASFGEWSADPAVPVVKPAVDANKK